MTKGGSDLNKFENLTKDLPTPRSQEGEAPDLPSNREG